MNTRAKAMKTVKSVLAGCAAAMILVATAALAGCFMGFDAPDAGSGAGQKAGGVVIRVDGIGGGGADSARTIMPNALSQSDVSYYVITLTKKDAEDGTARTAARAVDGEEGTGDESVAEDGPETITYTADTATKKTELVGGGHSFDLADGTWTVTVEAWRTITFSDPDGDGPEKAETGSYLAARGEAELTVTPEGPNTVSVTLNSLEGGAASGKKGVFYWNFILPDGVDLITFSFKTDGGTDLDLSKTVTEGVANGTKEIEKGVYDLSIELQNKTTLQTVGVYESVHIYPGLVTMANYDFTGGGSDALDFAAKVFVSGNLNIKRTGPAGETVDYTVQAYSDKDYTQAIAGATVVLAPTSVEHGAVPFVLSIPIYAYAALPTKTVYLKAGVGADSSYVVVSQDTGTCGDDGGDDGDDGGGDDSGDDGADTEIPGQITGLGLQGKTGVEVSIDVERRYTYTLTPPASKSGNGVTATVNFGQIVETTTEVDGTSTTTEEFVSLAPGSPLEAGTAVVARVTFAGMAAESRRFSLSLTSAKAGLSGAPRTFYVSIGANSFPYMDYAFTMPAQNIGAEDFTLDFNYSISAYTIQEMIDNSVKLTSATCLGIDKEKKTILYRIGTIENMFLQEVTSRLVGTGAPGPHTFTYDHSISDERQLSTLNSVQTSVTNTTGVENGLAVATANGWEAMTNRQTTTTTGTVSTVGAEIGGELGVDGAKISGKITASETEYDLTEKTEGSSTGTNGSYTTTGTHISSALTALSDSTTWSEEWTESTSETWTEGWSRTIEAGNIPIGKIWVGAAFATVSIYQILDYHLPAEEDDPDTEINEALPGGYATAIGEYDADGKLISLDSTKLLYNIESQPSFGVYEVSETITLPPGLTALPIIEDALTKAGASTPYPVTLDPQGGELTEKDSNNKVITTITVISGQPVPEKAVLPTRTGYTFSGYYTEPTGGTQYFTAAGTYARDVWDFAGVTLYAHWTGNKYTVTLDPNGGTGTKSVTATYGAVTLPYVFVRPTRAGYNFTGYYMAQTGDEQYYKYSTITSEYGFLAGAKTWDISTNTTLYAHWTPITYTVTLQKQSGTGGTSSVSATFGSMMSEAVTPPTRSGYAFVGYYSAVSDGTQYYNYKGEPQRAWNLTTPTLYAQWTPTTYYDCYANSMFTTEYDWQGDGSNPFQDPSNSFNVALLQTLGYTKATVAVGCDYCRSFWKSGIWPFQTTHTSGILQLQIFADASYTTQLGSREWDNPGGENESWYYTNGATSGYTTTMTTSTFNLSALAANGGKIWLRWANKYSSNCHFTIGARQVRVTASK